MAYAIAPDNYAGILKGKRYEVEWDDDDRSEPYGRGFYVILEDGYRAYCLERRCAYLDGANWTIEED